MALTTYKKKRTLTNTPEPTGGKSVGERLCFVIQKHAATRLHYDFRLEMQSVLKSWAVPKGPSLNPTDKRLAMMVEDHPYDYKDFEGIIPKGNYGAGSVIIWDEGFYEPLEGNGSKKEQEKILMKALQAGSVKIKMFGKKLKGEFALVKLKNAENNAWLLIKHKDEYASIKDITEKAKSVISGKTVEQMSKSKKAKEWQSNKNEKELIS
jgi:bifunctional non-homologous end joining protein LigD